MTERLRGQRLQDIRKKVLSAQPLCVRCLQSGLTHAAVEVDHIVPLHKGGTYDLNNLQGLCREHHREKTAEDMGHTYRAPIGVDGWPVYGNKAKK